jgi:voltage-gated potassium channel
MFAFFRDANFHDAGRYASIIGLALPVLGFLGACFVRRRQIAAMIRARRLREMTHLPRLARWAPGIAMIATVSFLLPRTALGSAQQGYALIAAMAGITGFVVFAARDVMLLLMDVAMIFEQVATRLNRLLMAVVAFLTFYSLLVVVFACLYRVGEMTTGVAQFRVFGAPQALSFGQALYFSVITLSTVGYGDIVPAGPLARVLATMEIVSGLLLLLFGFSEIMRARGPSDTDA